MGLVGRLGDLDISHSQRYSRIRGLTMPLAHDQGQRQRHLLMESQLNMNNLQVTGQPVQFLLLCMFIFFIFSKPIIWSSQMLELYLSSTVGQQGKNKVAQLEQEYMLVLCTLKIYLQHFLVIIYFSQRVICNGCIMFHCIKIPVF